ncbi:DNA excision repair protein ERCC-6-like 2 isoform X1 [Bufo bufo]|uniref:DNA excision repair protein ERCC-6-like 2 isoform X1 n=2 Tax=Bufo bufo TaxID=8384 RepID=UPI001ABDDE75|nr:DNA excision repair protein ERCC-6-like 2 isoform X1 [Bufo bufo]
MKISGMTSGNSSTKPANMEAQDIWDINDQCLAPYSEHGELKEAVIKSIDYKEADQPYAAVSFLDAKERKVPLSQLCAVSGPGSPWNKSMFDDEDLEKPHFPGKKPPAPADNFPLSNTGICVPYTINRYLRDYQREGVQFLYEHYARSTGCILGDDMGLGKTIQVISFLAAVLHKKGTREDIENNMPEFLLRRMRREHITSSTKRVFLIVSPLSVLFNWRDELETWGYFKISVIHGNRKDFELVRLRQGKSEIALTTYETLRLCLDDLNSVEWSAVIVDEVHKIKNPKARVTGAMKALRCKIRIGLTGTILQNNMEELWCVVDWAVPGCLGGKKQFMEEYSHPMELGQRHNATKRELATGRKVMQKLALKMSSLFLRRNKALISSQLPKKEDRIVYCSLTEFQKAVYQTVLETPDVSLVLRGSERCSCNSGKKRRNCCYRVNQYGESVKMQYFSYLAILRKVANHAALLQSDSNTSKKQEDHIQRICGEVFSKFPEFIQQSKEAAFETISDPKYSGKMKVLQQLLNHCRKNKDKVLLFSFSTKLLDVLERYCMASGLEYRRLDGGTKAEDRVKIVKEFNSMQDVNICLVSTMAGGLGLNFVGANVVVVFDPTWNPANDLQAIDRAYRIGQCRDVKVLRLIALGTVEEIIYLRQVYKQQLHCVAIGSENAKRYFKAVQGSKEHKGELFGIHNLFKLRTQGTCLTRDILEREGQVEAGIKSATMYLGQQSSSDDTKMEPVADGGEKTMNVNSNEQIQKEAFDFSSDSDDDIRENKKGHKISIKAENGKQLTLQQCGLSALLQKSPKKQDELSKSSTSNLSDNKALTIQNCVFSSDKDHEVNRIDWSISPDSGEDSDSSVQSKTKFTKAKPTAVEPRFSSDESDDIVFPTQVRSRRRIMLPKSEKSSIHQATDSSNDCISDESDDIPIPNKILSDKSHFSNLKYEQCHENRGAERNSQTIEAFSSSDEDQLLTKKMYINNKEQTLKTRTFRKPNPSFKWKYVRKNEDHCAHENKIKMENMGTFDQILDGVAEVAYMHSNQNVVGSSKAENHMSHWAVRDVFELNQFSQLPANVTAHVVEKCNLVNEDGFSQQSTWVKAPEDNISMMNPVVHKEKKVLQAGNATFLVGSTPKVIRKRHFEQMVTYFKMASGEELARYLVSVKSHVRQAMLREFYTKRYSEVEDLYPIQVPLTENEMRESKSKDKKNVIKMKRRKTCLTTSPEYTHKTTISVDLENSGNSGRKNKINVTKTDSLKDRRNTESSLTVPVEKSSNNYESKPTLHNTDLKVTAPGTSSSKEIKYFKEDHLFKQENLLGKVKRDSVADLLGDTSILDDLFTSQSNQRSAVLPIPSQCEPAKIKLAHRSKDFWDILNEQNDESINRLTDLSVIKKVSETSSLPSVSKKDSWNDSLWVKNEKFLWRKEENTQE